MNRLEELLQKNEYNLWDITTFFIATVLAILLVFIYTNLDGGSRDTAYNIGFLSWGLLSYALIFGLNIYYIIEGRKLVYYHTMTIIFSLFIFASLVAIYANLTTSSQDLSENLAIIITSSLFFPISLGVNGYRIYGLNKIKKG